MVKEIVYRRSGDLMKIVEHQCNALVEMIEIIAKGACQLFNRRQH
jgi:hypothetical protein